MIVHGQTVLDKEFNKIKDFKILKTKCKIYDICIKDMSDNTINILCDEKQNIMSVLPRDKEPIFRPVDLLKNIIDSSGSVVLPIIKDDKTIWGEIYKIIEDEGEYDFIIPNDIEEYIISDGDFKIVTKQ